MFKCEYKINVSEGVIDEVSATNAPYPKDIRARLSTLSGDPIHYFEGCYCCGQKASYSSSPFK